MGKIERGPALDEELVKEIKRIIQDRPRQSANGVYYDLVADHGYEFLGKKNWTQGEVYNTIRSMRDSGQVDWNAVTWIP
jgi:hypothetical protein